MRIVTATFWIVLAIAGPSLLAQGRGGRPAGSSPASQPPPRPAAPQAFPTEQVEAGRALFAKQCGFCHGRDAMGGEGGTDLTRSTIVAEDVKGNQIGPVVRNGRPDRGMPPFPVTDTDLGALVAFIQTQQALAGTLLGGRRSVDIADLQTGNADAGRRYFDANCTTCHSATGDLRGIAARLQGLPLLQRMLYPGGGGGRVAPPKVTVTTRAGETVTGDLAYRDEFTIALTDAGGWHRSWPAKSVTFTVDDRMQAHVDQLGKYTDKDMHDVLAYLHTLK